MNLRERGGIWGGFLELLWDPRCENDFEKAKAENYWIWQNLGFEPQNLGFGWKMILEEI